MKYLILVCLLVLSHCEAEIHHHLTMESPLVHKQSFSYGMSSGSSEPSGGSIFIGFILGPILFVCSFIMIWYNEKRAALDSRRLYLASEICVDVDSSSRGSIINVNEKLVYTTGYSVSSKTIGDPLSGINSSSAIKIRRIVYVSYWRSHQVTRNNRHETVYDLVWVTENIPYVAGRNNNPANWFITSYTFYNDQVYVGQYRMSKNISDLCSKAVPANMTMEHASRLATRANQPIVPTIQDNYIYFTPKGISFNPQSILAHAGSGEGTLRVRYDVCPLGPISIVGKSDKDTVIPFNLAKAEGSTDSNKLPDCCCCVISNCCAYLLKPIEYILYVKEETVSREDMFNAAIAKSECFTRGVRIASFLLMVLGICLFFSPITTLIGYIPLVGGFISGVIGFAILLAAVIVCLPLYLIATSIAWLVFRPKVGLILIGIGLVIAGVVIFFLTKSPSNSGGNGSPSHAYEILLRNV